MIETKRGELVDNLAKIGLVGSVKEGKFDVLFSESEAGPGHSMRITRLEEKTSKLETMTQAIDVSVINIVDLAARQEKALALQATVVERMKSELELNSKAHLQLDTHLTTHDAEINDLGAEVNRLGVRATALEGTDIAHTTRLVKLEGLVTGNEKGGLKELKGVVDLKADLVGGKIPLNQLPELPTGRKVTVKDSVERLALSVHADITIAYQQDDGRAYILGAAADPKVVANWNVLGNTQATGIQSFNGRTGVVMPTTGDYNTDIVEPTTDRQYIKQTDRLRWDDKATNESVQASVSGLRTEVANGYVPGKAKDFYKVTDNIVLKRSELGVNGGIATLGNDGKLLPAQVPQTGATTEQLARLTAVESSAQLANQKGDLAATNNLTLSTRIGNLENRVSAETIPIAQKGANSGVAPLDETGKVPAQFLPPAQGVSVPSKWVDVKSGRVLGAWYKNNSTNNMAVYISSVSSAIAGLQFTVVVRDKAGGSQFFFRSPTVGVTADKSTQINLHIPIGHEYSIYTQGGMTVGLIEQWYEFS